VKYSKSSVAKQNQHARWQKSQTDVDDVSRFGFWAGKNSRAHWGCRNRAQEILQQEPADGRNGKDGSCDRFTPCQRPPLPSIPTSGERKNSFRQTKLVLR